MKSRWMVDWSRTLLPVMAAAMVCAALAPIARADAKPQADAEPSWQVESDHWYIMEIAGATAGWMRETVSRQGDRFRTVTQSKLLMARGSDTLGVEMIFTFEETADGEPLRLTSRMGMSRQPIEDEYIFGPDEVKHITRQGGQERVATEPLPKGRWLTPREEHRYFMERAAAGAREIRYVTLNPEGGLELMHITKTLTGADEAIVNGRTVPVTVWSSTSSVMPGVKTIEQISDDGVLVRGELKLGGMTIVQRLAGEKEALAAEGGEAPEIMFSAFVRVDRPIENVSRVRKARLRLRVQEGEMPDLPSQGAQRVTPGADKQSAIVTIDVDNPSEEMLDDESAAQYLEPSALIDSDDALVVKLAERAVREAPESTMARAGAMRRFVHKFISSKSLDTAFASASEIARLREGDCSEHAVLLCAMLRSQGIPARLASGLVYIDSFGEVNHVFGWHMWTQANIDGKWIDLDASMPNPFHAGHILTTVTSLSDDSPTSELTSMVALIGNLEVEVLDAAPGD